MLSLPELVGLLGQVDDFCQHFEPAWKARLLLSGKPKRTRIRSLYTSEVIVQKLMLRRQAIK